MSNIGNGRVVKVCDLCGKVDDHPKHNIAGGVDGLFPAPTDEIMNAVIENAPADQLARLVRELVDTTSSDRHLDCCAAAGCPTGTCEPQVTGAPGTGADMVAHVVALREQNLFADRDDVVQAEPLPDVVQGEIVGAPVNTITESGS